jgi:hypothetical protein
VQHAALVGMMNRASHLAHHLRGGANPKTKPGISNGFREGIAFDKAHREEALTFVFAHLVNRHDMRIVQRSRRLSFRFEARDQIWRGQRPGANPLSATSRFTER